LKKKRYLKNKNRLERTKRLPCGRILRPFPESGARLIVYRPERPFAAGGNRFPAEDETQKRKERFAHNDWKNQQ
jgi:hypothetical protein